VALVRTEVLEEHNESIMSVERFSEVGTKLAVTSIEQLIVTAKVPSLLILYTQKLEAAYSFKTSAVTRAAQRHIPEDGIV
jgi:hypothetical protein